ncbi:MAG: sigma factor G inhibitor Gin [Bacillota bacterium]|nr:hypothetical protein [Bacillota bacterium]
MAKPVRLVSSMDTPSRKCHICQGDALDGVRLAAGYICPDCLRLIGGTQVGDTMYAYFVARLKELWQAG